MFQFQTGAIKSSYVFHGKRTVIRFNSKLVRLKARAWLASQEWKLRFNSKLVRLKGL